MIQLQRFFGVTILFVLLASVGMLALAYGSRQRELTLEGNDLYSSERIVVSADIEDLNRRMGGSKPPFVAYKRLDGSGRIRAVHSSDPASFPYPLHRGRQFSDADRRAALVGGNVATRTVGDRDVFDYDGHGYEVVGYLGRAQDSLLQDDVLLVDDALFGRQTEETLFLDGAHIQERFRDAFPGQKIGTMNQSTNRRTSIDLVSPVLLTLSYGIQVLGAVFLGLIVAAFTRRRSRIAALIGRSRFRIWGGSLAQLLGPACVAAAASVVAGSSALAREGLRDLVYDLGAVFVISAAAMSVTLVAQLRRPR